MDYFSCHKIILVIINCNCLSTVIIKLMVDYSIVVHLCLEILRIEYLIVL